MFVATVGLSFRFFNEQWGRGSAFATYDIGTGAPISSVRYGRWFSGWQDAGWSVHWGGQYFIIEIRARLSRSRSARPVRLLFNIETARVRAFPNWQRQLTDIVHPVEAVEEPLNWIFVITQRQLCERLAAAVGGPPFVRLGEEEEEGEEWAVV